MARINLLPWREEERERRNKEFITLVAVTTLLSLLAAFAIWSYFNNQLAEQQRANALIEQRISELDAALVEIEGLEQRREDIISRMQVVQDLQGTRPIPVHIWDDIPKAIPSAMYINQLQREGDTLILTGMADNPNIVSDLIRNLDASEWMGDSAVRTIQQNISAYETPRPQPSMQGGEQSSVRPIYPEDDYVEFVVTTQVQHDAKLQDEDLSQGLASNATAAGEAS